MADKILRPGSQMELGYRDLPPRPEPTQAVRLPEDFADGCKCSEGTLFSRSPICYLCGRTFEDEDKPMNEISQFLSIYTDATGKRTRGCTEQELQALYERLWTEFEDSDVGRKLAERGSPDIFGRIFDIYAERCSSRPPAVQPAFETLEEIGRDLLLDLPVPEAPKPAPKANLAPAPLARKAPEPSSECQRYAFLYNAALLEHGIASLRPASGVVTIRVGMGQNLKSYRFPADESARLFNEAIQFGLIA